MYGISVFFQNNLKAVWFLLIICYLHGGLMIKRNIKSMNRTFHSQVGGWYWLLMAVTAFLLFDFFWFHYTVPTLLMAVVMIFEIEMLIHTRYVVSADKVLYIESGRFVPNREIPLAAISEMRQVKSYALAPALSFRRIELSYEVKGKKEKVWVSPQNEEDFMQWINRKKAESTDE